MADSRLKCACTQITHLRAFSSPHVTGIHSYFTDSANARVEGHFKISHVKYFFIQFKGKRWCHTRITKNNNKKQQKQHKYKSFNTCTHAYLHNTCTHAYLHNYAYIYDSQSMQLSRWPLSKSGNHSLFIRTEERQNSPTLKRPRLNRMHFSQPLKA